MSQPSSSPAEQSIEAPLVPLADVARFLRQLSHDMRNHLNAAELQSAYLGELIEDAEMKEEVKRLRAMLSEMSTSLQRVTDKLAPIDLTLMPYAASDFMEDLRAKIATQFPAESDTVEWTVNVGSANLEIDPQILQPAFLELFANASQHERGSGPLQVTAGADGSDFIFNLVEPKAAFTGETDKWGRQPFATLKHGHYGLGLPRVRSIIEAHHGQLRAHYDPVAASLITTIVLPLGNDA